MKTNLILIVGGLFGGLLMMFIIHKDLEKRIVPILSAQDYCRSVGYDFVSDRDSERVKCAYSRSGTDGKNIKGYAWYQYPPKTDLENYCSGKLKNSATIIYYNF